MDSGRFFDETTTGYLTDPKSPALSAVRETEIMVMDRAYNCEVIYRRYVRHRDQNPPGRILQRKLRAARDWAVVHLS